MTLLPSCMIGPSEPCEAFQELYAEIERLRAERNLLREMFNSAERELAAERERCAKIAEGKKNRSAHIIWNDACEWIAAAIRRGDEK